MLTEWQESAMSYPSNEATEYFHGELAVYVDDCPLHVAMQQKNHKPGQANRFAPSSLPVAQLHSILHDYISGCHLPARFHSQDPLQRRFEVIARTTPCAVAVDVGGRRLTYGELDEQADALALHLQAGGLVPGSFCLIDLEPSLAQVRVILAVLKAGATCLQCDSQIAQGAAATMLAVVRPAVLFTRAGAGAGRAADQMRTIPCEEDAADLPFGWPDELPVCARTPAHAYATVSADGDLCIFVRTHQALGRSLDNATAARPALWADADPGGLWRPLSSGAPLTIQARG
jgi:non-ribosomal peptide synthetase component F